MQFLIGVVVFCPLISALAFIAPGATPVDGATKLHGQSWSPQPTEPPEFKELLKRQSSGSLTLIEGPDSICGFQFGASEGALGLCGTSVCGFATALDQDGDIVCFGPTTSEARPPWTSCIGGAGAASCLADSACSDNPGIIVCTDSIESHCNVGTFMGLGVEAVWCDSTSYSGSTIPISTTYFGQLGRALTNPGGAVQTATTSTPAHSSPTTPTPTPPPLPKTTTPITPIPTPAPSPSPQSKSSTPVGPIVGGVIGGLALITAIIAGIFFCIRRKRKDGQTTPEISSSLPVETYTQSNNTHPQYPSEKYSATAEAAFIPPGSRPMPAKPEQQIHYQQPAPQPQYQQHPPVLQPSYNPYRPPPQQSPQPTGNYVEQQQPVQQPVQQNPQHYPQDSQAQSHLPVAHAQSFPHELSDTHRGSVISAVSAPGSPAPPYASRIPTVPEGTGDSSQHAYPIEERYEMPM